jgi:hypothetical protein
MRTEEINRREFLERSAQAAGAVVVSLAGGTMLLAADGAWALELRALDGGTAQTLLRMVRLIYPHDMLGDQYYAGVVEALDGEAKESADVLALLNDGVANLDKSGPMPFLALSPGAQEQALHAIASSDFFQKVRFKVVTVLYNDPRVWQAFGYEGPSFEDGGYIERGFDDLAWLPNPPEEASPPKA